jgi:hypothetical protein
MVRPIYSWGLRINLQCPYTIRDQNCNYPMPTFNPTCQPILLSTFGAHPFWLCKQWVGSNNLHLEDLIRVILSSHNSLCLCQQHLIVPSSTVKHAEYWSSSNNVRTWLLLPPWSSYLRDYLLSESSQVEFFLFQRLPAQSDILRRYAWFLNDRLDFSLNE